MPRIVCADALLLYETNATSNLRDTVACDLSLDLRRHRITQVCGAPRYFSGREILTWGAEPHEGGFKQGTTAPLGPCLQFARSKSSRGVLMEIFLSIDWHDTEMMDHELHHYHHNHCHRLDCHHFCSCSWTWMLIISDHDNHSWWWLWIVSLMLSWWRPRRCVQDSQAPEWDSNQNTRSRSHLPYHINNEIEVQSLGNKKIKIRGRIFGNGLTPQFWETIWYGCLKSTCQIPSPPIRNREREEKRFLSLWLLTQEFQ